MERIGRAASKIARGNLGLYNFYVVLISFLFSLLIFFICGSSVVIALILMAYAMKGTIPPNFEKEWISIIMVCMITLVIVIILFTLVAISRNIKFRLK